jgi:1-acyl-sn-glycerol-3-phosphate acyltransferase
MKCMLYLLKKICLLWWNIFGWKITGRFPHEVKKMVIIIGPHTSTLDTVVGVGAWETEKIQHVHFFAKKELFEGIWRFFFKGLGGIPVDRSHPHGMVGQAVEAISKEEWFRLGLSPEGTRSKVEKLRTGFYHIAKQAGIPILMIGFDFETRQVIIADLFFPTDNMEADLKHIISFFASIKGRNPEKGMGHLLQEK